MMNFRANQLLIVYENDDKQLRVVFILTLTGPLEAVDDGEFEDLLQHGSKSDLKWSMKDYRPPRYRYLRYRYIH